MVMSCTEHEVSTIGKCNENKKELTIDYGLDFSYLRLYLLFRVLEYLLVIMPNLLRLWGLLRCV